MLSKLHQPAILCVKYLVKFKKKLSSLAKKSVNSPPFHPPNCAQPLVRTPPWVELNAAPSDITSHCPCAPQKLALTHHAQRPESPARRIKECPLRRSRFLKDISSSNHQLAGDICWLCWWRRYFGLYDVGDFYMVSNSWKYFFYDVKWLMIKWFCSWVLHFHPLILHLFQGFGSTDPGFFNPGVPSPSRLSNLKGSMCNFWM